MGFHPLPSTQRTCGFARCSLDQAQGTPGLQAAHTVIPWQVGLNASNNCSIFSKTRLCHFSYYSKCLI